MKQFTNPLSVRVELSQVGVDVIAARVSLSLAALQPDCQYISARILDELLPDFISYRQLFDGSFVLVSDDDCKAANISCIDAAPISMEFDAIMELDDGVDRDVHFALDKTSSVRRDYRIRDTRFIILRGSVVVDVEEDEESEE